MSMETMTEQGRRTTWQLARMADCGDPDTGDGVGMEGYADPAGEGSPGARLLRHVEDAVIEAWEEYDHGGDPIDVQREFEREVHEIADGAPDVYTHTRWAEFVDLAAYQEEMGELVDLAGPDADMTQAAGVALYMIAERLCWAILEELAEQESDRAEMEGPWLCAGCGDSIVRGEDEYVWDADLAGYVHVGSCQE